MKIEYLQSVFGATFKCTLERKFSYLWKQFRKMLRLSFLRGRTWKYIAIIVFPIVLLPLLLVDSTSESRCGYVILLMAAYWTLEPIPLAATSLLPIVLFPLLGVISTSEACAPYMNVNGHIVDLSHQIKFQQRLLTSSNKSTIMMFVGGLMMAVAIEDCNLHKRIALNVLLRIQPTASWMMLGFMMTAMFLSMWISNTATAALMVPIVEAVLCELESKSSQRKNSIPLKTISVISDSTVKSNVEIKSIETIYPEPPVKNLDPLLPLPDVPIGTDWSKKRKGPSKSEVLRKAMFLSIAYSSNVGGTGTITGTGPNLVVKGIVEDMFPESNDLSFDKWMMYNVPVMLLCVFVAWGYLQLIYIRKCVVDQISTVKRGGRVLSGAPKYTKEMKESFKEIIRRKHEELGPMSFQEKAITTLFVFLVMLWIFRDPQFVSGWGKHFPVKVRDATPAIGVPLLLFVIPSNPWQLSRSRPLMEWKNLQAKLPWGIILLLGGGFSLAEGSKHSGLSMWASRQLAFLNISSPVLVVAVLCLLTATLTEVTSNVATANVLLPVVAQLALATKVHPIYYLLPVTISCSFAFMLPVATPPNAIVFDAGQMKTLDMVKPGIFMNILCVIIEVVMINSLGLAVFDFKHFPAWANTTLNSFNTTGS